MVVWPAGRNNLKNCGKGLLQCKSKFSRVKDSVIDYALNKFQVPTCYI